MVPTKTVTKFDYLHSRPFLLIDHYAQPKKDSDKHANNQRLTERKGWMNDRRNVSIDEVPTLINHVSRTRLRQATVIIDIANNMIIKNRLSDGDEAVLAHYQSKYADLMERGRQLMLTAR